MRRENQWMFQTREEESRNPEHYQPLITTSVNIFIVFRFLQIHTLYQSNKTLYL